MSLFKEQPHLFTNGKFKALSGGVTFKIIGSHTSCGSWLISKHSGDYQVKDCTLIARPISDMTDEEKDEIWSYFGTDDTWEEHRLSLEENYRMHAGGSPDVPTHISTEEEELEDIITSHTPSTLKSLSIGVYPGNQDDGNVIFKSKHEENNNGEPLA